MRFSVPALALALLLFPPSAFAADPTATLKRLKKPVGVSEAQMYRDGGTIFIALKDKDGAPLQLCLDGRLDSPSAGQLFLGTSHPSSGGTPLESGSKAEGSVVSLLEDWLKGRPKDAANAPLVRSVIERVRERGRELRAAAASGPFTKEQAVAVAKKTFPLKMNKLRVEDTPKEFVLRFVTDPFKDAGKTKQSAFVMRVSKATRKVLHAGAEKVWEVP